MIRMIRDLEVMPLIIMRRNGECQDKIGRVHDSHLLESGSHIIVYILSSSNWQKLGRGKFLFHMDSLGLYSSASNRNLIQ